MAMRQVAGDLEGATAAGAGAAAATTAAGAAAAAAATAAGAAAAAAAAAAESNVPKETKAAGTATAAEGVPLWRQVFLRRSRIKHLLQHEWFADVCTAHAAALEENRRLLANHASILAVRSAAAAQEGGAAGAAAGTGSPSTDQRLLVQSSQDAAALKQQVRTIQAAAVAAQRQYDKHRRHLETELLLLQQQVQQQQQALADKDRELLQQQRLLREKEEEVSEKEAQAAATRRTCLLLVQQQQQQQLAVQKAQQEVAAKALETEGYLRELLRYKQAEAASLELLQQQMSAAPQANTDSAVADSAAAAAAAAASVSDSAAPAATACAHEKPQSAAEAVRAAVAAHAAAAPSSAAARAAAAAASEANAAAAASSSSSSNRSSSQTRREAVGRGRQPLRLMQTTQIHTGAALCCCCRPTAAAGDPTASELLISGGADGTLAVSTAASGRSLYSFVPSPLRAACTAVDLMLRQQLLSQVQAQEQQYQEAVALVGCIDASLYVAQLPRGKVVETLKGHGGSILACGFTQPQGDTAAATAAAPTAPATAAWSVANDRSVRLWDMHRSACTRAAVLFSRPTAAAAADGGGMLLVGHRNGTLGIFSPSSPSSGSSKSSSRSWAPEIVSPAMHNSEAIVGVAISNDRHTVCTLGEDKTLQLLDLRMLLQYRQEQQAVLTHPLLRRNTVVASPCFSPCGRMLAAATGSYLLLWDVQQFAGVHTPQAGVVDYISRSDSADRDGISRDLSSVGLHQPEQKEDDGLLSVLHCTDAEICCLSWSSSSSRLFAGCRDGTVLVWE